MHLTWYSSTHKKGDSDFLRSATMRTPLIGWMHVGQFQRHMYHSQCSWCPSHWPRLVSQTMTKSSTHRPQCHVDTFSILQSPNNTTVVKMSKIRKWWLDTCLCTQPYSLDYKNMQLYFKVRTQVDSWRREWKVDKIGR